MTSILNPVLISVEEDLADYVIGVKTDIFKRIYLNPVKTKGAFDNYDLSRSLEYVDGCTDALLEGHRKVVSFCENTIKDMDIYEARSFFSEIRDMWFDSFVNTYAHPNNAVVNGARLT